jgi:hypothetical protein
MADEFPGDDGFGETKGWDRASIAFRSRKPYVPGIKTKDLLLPNETGKVRTFGLCVVSAVCLTVLYVFVPLLLVGILVPIPPWLRVGLLCGALLGFTVLLFVFSTVETRQLRRLAKEL